MRVSASVLLALLACLLAGCGLFGGGLEGRAASYYNFMVGRAPKAQYSTFLSPPYREQFKKPDLAALNQFMRQGEGKAANERYPECRSEHVTTAVEGRFAYTVADPRLGNAYSNLEPQRWVKDGLRWYIYHGSASELQKYGPFPPTLAAPHVPLKPHEE